MITEDYVSFETAKLLKEKGFDFCCESQYINCSSGHPFLTDIRDDAGCYYKNSEIEQDAYSAPTLQMVMKWLRKVYNIHFSIEPYTIFPENINCKVFYSVEIQQLVTDNEGILYKGELEIKHYIDDIESYEEACEAAIKYCLDNLI